VRLATKTVAIACGLLTAVLAAGCGAGALANGASSPAGGAGPVSPQGCTDYGVYAIDHHITVTRTPAACRGLSKAQVSQAAALAILRVAGGNRKAIWRKRAAEVAPFLDHLITAPAPGPEPSLPPAAAWPGTSAPATGRPGGRDLAMDTAALLAWLVTAGSGAYVLGSWISGGGSLRPAARRADSTGSPPAVIIGHFGLALTGLVLWVIYLAVGWAALAWTAVCVLVPVAGLGMAAVTVGLPGRVFAPEDGGEGNAAREAGGDTATASGAGTAVLLRRARRAPSVRASLSPLIVVGHGLLAVTTMLLVLLAAIGVRAG
jgi:manganese efflux pump family protein